MLISCDACFRDTGEKRSSCICIVTQASGIMDVRELSKIVDKTELNKFLNRTNACLNRKYPHETNWKEISYGELRDQFNPDINFVNNLLDQLTNTATPKQKRSKKQTNRFSDIDLILEKG